MMSIDYLYISYQLHVVHIFLVFAYILGTIAVQIVEILITRANITDCKFSDHKCLNSYVVLQKC